jgi:hypothetical protein
MVLENVLKQKKMFDIGYHDKYQRIVTIWIGGPMIEAKGVGELFVLR